MVTAAPVETIFTVARRMRSQNVSCAVVVDEGAVVGLFTQRDLLLGIAQEQEGYGQLPVAERMTSPVMVAPPDLPVLEASRILKSKRIKHLPIVAEGRLVGIVSQTDILHALERRLAEEEKHRLFLVCSDIPMFMLDAGGALTYVNAAFLRLFEKGSQAQVVGTSLLDARFWSSPQTDSGCRECLTRGGRACSEWSR